MPGQDEEACLCQGKTLNPKKMLDYKWETLSADVYLKALLRALSQMFNKGFLGIFSPQDFGIEVHIEDFEIGMEDFETGTASPKDFGSDDDSEVGLATKVTKVDFDLKDDTHAKQQLTRNCIAIIYLEGRESTDIFSYRTFLTPLECSTLSPSTYCLEGSLSDTSDTCVSISQEALQEHLPGIENFPSSKGALVYHVPTGRMFLLDADYLD
jgi:hypothetical protein